MKNKDKFPAEDLAMYLRYEPETGKLFWLPRPREMCADDRFFAIYKSRCEGKQAFTADNGTGYRCGIIAGHKVKAHRAAWALYHGAWPDGSIDHINHDRSDNRISNLRVVDARANARNSSMRKDNKSGRVGVRWHVSGAWIAMGRIDGVSTQLLYTKSYDDACAARELFERANGYHRNHGAPQ